MTPKQKAEDLYAKYEDVNHMFHKYNKVDDIINHAKESALLAVDEVLEATKRYDYTLGPNPSYNDYWLKVKYHIEHL